MVGVIVAAIVRVGVGVTTDVIVAVEAAGAFPPIEQATKLRANNAIAQALIISFAPFYRSDLTEPFKSTLQEYNFLGRILVNS
jgi:hypothetical protein